MLSSRQMIVLAIGLTAIGSQGHAHSYQQCMEFLAGDCLHQQDEWQQSVCYSQADAACSNHNHPGGGGGVNLLEPILAIEDRGLTVVVTVEFDLGVFAEERRQVIKDILIAGAEARQARHQLMAARFRMLISGASEEEEVYAD